MNILALTSVYPQPDDAAGVTATVQYFAQKWAQAGENVLVVHSPSRFPALFYWTPESLRQKAAARRGFTLPTNASRKPLKRDDFGVKVYRRPMVKTIPHSRFSKAAIRRQTRKIEAILAENDFRPDWIAAHWANPQVDLVRELKRKFPTARTSIVFHHDCRPRDVEKYGLRDAANVFDAIGCRSEAEALDVQKILGLPRKPFVCYSGIPDEEARRQEAFLQSGAPLPRNREFVFVGRLVAYKRVDAILNAFAKAFPQKDFKLHIVGDGAELDKLQDLTQKLGLNDAVAFRGRIPRDEVAELMRRSFGFTMISEHETFGMVYIESMLGGCLTIASKGGGVDGVVVDGENGFLSPEGDADALAELLRKVAATDPDELDKIRVAGIQTALEFRDSAVAARYSSDVASWKESEKSERRDESGENESGEK